MQDPSQRRVERAPNYTVPALIMGAVNLFWILAVLWALYGIWAALFVAWGLERAIHGLGLRRSRGFDQGAQGRG